MPLTVPASTDSDTWQASDYGLIAMNWDPAIGLSVATTTLTTAGRLNIHRLPVPSASITNLHIYVTTVGATLTSGQCKAALYQDLNLIGTTADQSTAWTSLGFKTMALASGPFAVHAGLIDIALWYNGTTAPALYRGASQTAINLGLTENRTGLGATGNTTTAPSTIATNSGTGTTFWVGVS